MSDIPQDLLYTDAHEWIRVDGDVATVGITDHAQNALGDLTFVELPEVGAELAQGDEACAVESCKAAVSVYAPASGTVVEVNQALDEAPELINSDCYGDGWILKLRLASQDELADLKSPEDYAQFLAEEE